MDAFIFFRALGVVTLAILLAGGLGYWLLTFFNKYRYQIKYKILRMKHKEEDVAMLVEDLVNGVNEEEMYKTIILSNKASPEKANELIYIYKELKKLQLKGGIRK